MVNRDPIGELGGLNLYAYVLNSPVNAVDPLGLQGDGVTRAGDIYSCSFTEGLNELKDLLTDLGQFVLKELAKELLFSLGLLAVATGVGLVAGGIAAGLGMLGRGLRLGARAASRFGRASRGSVAIDANALIRGIEKGELTKLDNLIGNRNVTVSLTAAKEFLKKGNVNHLRQFLVSRGGSVGQAATRSQITHLQAHAQQLGRKLRTRDAAVAGSAIKENAVIITRDQRFYNFLVDAGIPTEYF